MAVSPKRYDNGLKYEPAPRETAHNRGYSFAWSKARTAHIRANQLCVHCLRRGITKQADCIDHITRHHKNYTLLWDEANWQPLCNYHHWRKTKSEMNASNVTLVYGPPAAGKSSYVAARKNDGEIVLDVDLFWQCITGGNRATRPEHLWQYVDRVFRQAVVEAQLSKATAWVIMGGATERERLVCGVNATRVLIEPGEQECHARADRDASRANNIRQHHEWIANWYRRQDVYTRTNQLPTTGGGDGFVYTTRRKTDR